MAPYYEPPVHQISGLIITPANRDYVIDLSAGFNYVVESITTQTGAGSCTIALKINTTNITGLSAVSATATLSTANSTGANIVSLNQKLTLTISAISGIDNLSYSVRVRRI